MKIGNIQNVNINRSSNYSMKNRINYSQPTFTAKQPQIYAKRGFLSSICMGLTSLCALILGRSKDKSNVELSKVEEKEQDIDWGKYAPESLGIDDEDEEQSQNSSEIDWSDYAPDNGSSSHSDGAEIFLLGTIFGSSINK